jgi:antitoxin component HigA of HigAB toxin-antitoxin module
MIRRRDEQHLAYAAQQGRVLYHHPIQAPDAVEVILFAMEQRGLTRRDLEPCIGSRARVAEISLASAP